MVTGNTHMSVLMMGGLLVSCLDSALAHNRTVVTQGGRMTWLRTVVAVVAVTVLSRGVLGASNADNYFCRACGVVMEAAHKTMLTKTDLLRDRVTVCVWRGGRCLRGDADTWYHRCRLSGANALDRQGKRQKFAWTSDRKWSACVVNGSL